MTSLANLRLLQGSNAAATWHSIPAGEWGWLAVPNVG